MTFLHLEISTGQHGVRFTTDDMGDIMHPGRPSTGNVFFFSVNIKITWLAMQISTEDFVCAPVDRRRGTVPGVEPAYANAI